MGMFDDVLCEAPLPDGYTGTFQTKDFDCTMTWYKITEGGRLLREVGAYVDAPEREFFKIRWERSGWEDTKFHGVVNFYHSADGIRHEYNAKFTDGQLVEITLAAEPSPEAVPAAHTAEPER